MTKHYKVNEDVEVGGTLRAAGTYFSYGEDYVDESLESAIAEGKVTNVAPEDVPQDTEAAAESEGPKDEASSTGSSADEASTQETVGDTTNDAGQTQQSDTGVAGNANQSE